MPAIKMPAPPPPRGKLSTFRGRMASHYHKHWELGLLCVCPHASQAEELRLPDLFFNLLVSALFKSVSF